MLDRLSERILQAYYAATIVFLLLDFGYGINIRLVFLDDTQLWRLVYYGLCAGIFALMLWRPGWTDTLGALESGVTLGALIIGMARRGMLVSDEMIETGTGFLTVPELINFAIAGGIGWLAFRHHSARMHAGSR